MDQNRGERALTWRPFEVLAERKTAQPKVVTLTAKERQAIIMRAMAVHSRATR